MSRRNGDRARFRINQKRKRRHRQRLRTLLATVSRREDPLAGESGGSKVPAEELIDRPESPRRVAKARAKSGSA
jgi:hypothetical protein